MDGSSDELWALMLDRLIPPVCDKTDVYTITQIVMMVFSTTPCFKACLSKALGIGIVMMATLIKIPQLLKLWASKSSEGISIESLMVEQFSYVYNLAIHYREQYPITTYGDFASIMVQNMILILLVFLFRKRAPEGIAIVLFFSLLLAWMCSGYFPLEVLRFLTSLNMVMSLGSRMPQIISNYKNKSTGLLSPITCVGLAMGSTARVFTTLQEVPSWRILAGYLTSATMNSTIATQIFLYRGSKAAVAPAGEAKKEKSADVQDKEKTKEPETKKTQ